MAFCSATHASNSSSVISVRSLVSETLGASLKALASGLVNDTTACGGRAALSDEVDEFLSVGESPVISSAFIGDKFDEHFDDGGDGAVVDSHGANVVGVETEDVDVYPVNGVVAVVFTTQAGVRVGEWWGRGGVKGEGHDTLSNLFEFTNCRVEVVAGFNDGIVKLGLFFFFFFLVGGGLEG